MSSPVNWRDQFQLAGKPFEYSIGFNISDYKSVITKYDNPERSFAKDYYEGMEIGEIWGFVTDGFFKTDEEAKAYAKEVDLSYSSGRLTGGWLAGDLKFVDLDGDGIWGIGGDTVDNPGDRKILGNSRPTLSYGFNASIRWMGFDASVFFQGYGQPLLVPQRTDDELLGLLLRLLPLLYADRFPRQGMVGRQSRRLFPASARLLRNGRLSGQGQRPLSAKHPLPAPEKPDRGLHHPREPHEKGRHRPDPRLFSGENLAYWSPLKRTPNTSTRKPLSTVRAMPSSTAFTIRGPKPSCSASMSLSNSKFRIQ